MSLVPLIPKSSAGSIITPPFSNACLRTYKPGRGDFVPALSPILEYVGPPFLHPFRIAGAVLHLVYWNRGKKEELSSRQQCVRRAHYCCPKPGPTRAEPSPFPQQAHSTPSPVNTSAFSCGAGRELEVWGPPG